MVYSCPKKSGKTAIAAVAMIYTVVVLGGRYAEGDCVANDFEQAQGRVYRAIARIIEAFFVQRKHEGSGIGQRP